MPDSRNLEISRRNLIQAVGGITFLALVPTATAAGVEHALDQQPLKARKGPLPLFIALPYLQAGPNGSKLVHGQESIVIAWQTNGVKAEYELLYGEHDMAETAKIAIGHRWSGDKSEGEQRINFSATLEGLKLGARYKYRVIMDGERILEGYFTTRKPRGTKVRFVAFGDNSYGEISDRAIAYQAYRAMPDFVMNTGDNVYESGLDNEYARYFFPIYNADEAGPRLGAPLLRSVPFYTVLANHDVHGKDENGVLCADFTKTLDALAYFTNMHLPLNGPVTKNSPRVIGPAKNVDAFKEIAADRYPTMGNYSYDVGDLHFLCLDSNVYVDPTDAEYQRWIASDLDGTDAAWKIVVYHHPAFNAGNEHYDEQHMRALSPLFEKHGVTMVLHGHEHTYQRSMPLKFAPKDLSGAQDVGGKQRLVPGTFTVDTNFDGHTRTVPDGVIYIVTGAGGKHLYDAAMNDDSTKWTHEEDDHVAYIAKFICDRHSLSVVDADARSISFRQVDEWGNEVDAFRITKKA